jgi:hypothetical protein
MFQKKRSPQKARGLISRGSEKCLERNKAPKRLEGQYLIEAKNVLEEMKPPKGKGPNISQK